MESEVSLTIDGNPPSPNVSTKAGSWHARAKSRQQWRDTAALVALTVKQGTFLKCDLAVEHVLPNQRRRDLDNLAAAIKPIIDGLVDAGLLRTDDFQCIQSIRHTYRVQTGVRATVITIRGETA